MRVKVRPFNPLRDTSGKSTPSEDMRESLTLFELVQKITREEGIDFKKLLIDPVTSLPFPNVSILVNGRHNRFINGLRARLKDGDLIDP